jgi:hypothetical protein
MKLTLINLLLTMTTLTIAFSFLRMARQFASSQRDMAVGYVLNQLEFCKGGGE